MENLAKKRNKRVEFGANSKHGASLKLSSILVWCHQTSISIKRSSNSFLLQLSFSKCLEKLGCNQKKKNTIFNLAPSFFFFKFWNLTWLQKWNWVRTWSPFLKTTKPNSSSSFHSLTRPSFFPCLKKLGQKNLKGQVRTLLLFIVIFEELLVLRKTWMFGSFFYMGLTFWAQLFFWKEC
jgi:hypothetical protein